MGVTLVAGAAGLIGSRLSVSLAEEGRRVVGVDNLITGKEERIRALSAYPHFEFVREDVCRADWSRYAWSSEITEIYHLASPASPVAYGMYPFETIAANTDGTRNLLELARLVGASFLFAGTSEAYGDPEVHPQNEEHPGNAVTWGRRACYYEAKKLGEVYAFEYGRRFGLRTKVARIFNTYSPDLFGDDGRVISNMMEQAMNGLDLTIYGDGRQTRSFCHVDDTVLGLRRMMDSDRANGQLINIGNPEESTILDLARLIIVVTGATGSIQYRPLPDNDPKKRRPDIGKAQRLLDWRPTIGLEEGLRRTWEELKLRSERMNGSG